MYKALVAFFRNLLWMLLSLLVTLGIALIGAYLYLDKQLPNVDQLKSVQLPIPMRIYTSDAQLIAEFGELRRTPVKLNQVPPLLIKAIVATEDQRFFEHAGVDWYGLLRASSELLITGTKSQGGSTITMQVARNFYLTRKKTFIRKITEMLLALKIERELTKHQILELYLNKIYLGNRAYGVVAAAQVYYGKTLNQLALPEIAMIAGLPKAPSAINPLANPVAAKQRRDHVLARMYDEGFINQKEYEAAVNTPVTSVFHGETIPTSAPYVAEMARDMMLNSFGDDAYIKGYQVYTTINSHEQAVANEALRKALLAYDQRHGYRGPEKNLGKLDPQKIKDSLLILRKMQTVNGLRPAVVVALTNTTITGLLSDDRLITLSSEGLAWANLRFKNGVLVSHTGLAANPIKIGSIIRVEKKDDAWFLAQTPKIQGAFVALNPQTGAINVLVGGFDFHSSNFNRVTQAERQPGSGFKPFIYSAALAKGYTLSSVFQDEPLVFDLPGWDKPWRPQNDDHQFWGPMRLRMALAKSRNLISVRVLQAIDLPYALNYLERFGFNVKKLPRNLSLALGTGEVTPMELARGYAILANGGYRITPYLIDRITDKEGQQIYQSLPKIACSACITSDDDGQIPAILGKDSPYAPQVLPASIAYLMTSALKDVIRYGTGRAALALGRGDLAGKTGTTSDYIDTWFSGFNSDIVAVAWVGFDQPSSIHEYGAKAALPMWMDFMGTVLAHAPEHTMPKPVDIVQLPIDSITGGLVSPDTPGAVMEYFRKNNTPAESIQEDEATSDGIDLTQPSETE